MRIHGIGIENEHMENFKLTILRLVEMVRVLKVLLDNNFFHVSSIACNGIHGSVCKAPNFLSKTLRLVVLF